MDKLSKKNQDYGWALKQMSDPDSEYRLSDISSRLYTETLIRVAIRNGQVDAFDRIPKHLRTYRVCLDGAQRGICRLRDVPANVVMTPPLALALCKQDARNIYGMPKRMLTRKFLLKLAKTPGYFTMEVLTGYCLENGLRDFVPELMGTMLRARDEKSVSGYALEGTLSVNVSALRLLLGSLAE